MPRINFDLMDKKNDLTCSLFDFSAKGFFVIDFYIYIISLYIIFVIILCNHTRVSMTV